MKKQQDRITKEDRESFYKVLFSRRDVRAQFLNKPIPADVLDRILKAAHHAPSVGFMQPWDFILIRSLSIRKKIHEEFTVAHHQATKMFPSEKQDMYASLKLEGILESHLNICVTCDPDRTGPVVIGRTHIPEMDLYSSVCAIQNLWLAARAEHIGVGWVSIFDEEKVRNILGIPDRIQMVGYLCLGYVDYFYTQPELETAGWQSRLPIEELLHYDQWENTTTTQQT